MIKHLKVHGILKETTAQDTGENSEFTTYAGNTRERTDSLRGLFQAIASTSAQRKTSESPRTRRWYLLLGTSKIQFHF